MSNTDLLATLAALPPLRAVDTTLLAPVEAALGHAFSDPRWLRWALTSKGWVNEHPDWKDNKALEWLGDALLYRVVTEHFVLSGAAQCTGAATPQRVKLINNTRLAEVAEGLGLWDALYLGVGERRNNQADGRTRFLSCAMEALLGAAYMDARTHGQDANAQVDALVRRHLLQHLDA